MVGLGSLEIPAENRKTSRAMKILSLIIYLVTVFVGLFLLAIWLIEYDPDYQRAEATRLPVTVVSSHVLLAVTGLGFWVVYLVTDMTRLAWVTVAVLALVVILGLTMAVRWLGVYRAHRNTDVQVTQRADGGESVGLAVPPERHFPLAVVIGHGVLAMTTVVFVLLTTLGVGGS
jgi:hypothetical protein